MRSVQSKQRGKPLSPIQPTHTESQICVCVIRTHFAIKTFFFIFASYQPATARTEP